HQLPVEKGQLIGYSGNSGGSGGPHLHFEIRDTKTEHPVNPLLFGLEVKDNLAPTLSGIWVVPLNDSSRVAGSAGLRNFVTTTSSGKCALETKTPIQVYGEVGFAVHTIDKLDGNSNRCGVYRVELYMDSLLIFAQTLNELDFATNRAINAHTWYEKFKKEKTSIHRSYRLVNNPLHIYDNLVNDGIVSFRDGRVHQMTYVVKDINGNTSKLDFKVQAETSLRGETKPKEVPQTVFHYEQDNELDLGDIKVFVDAFSLYEDLDFNIRRQQTRMDGAISSTYVVASPYVPVHAHYSLQIKPAELPAGKENKALIVRWDPEKDRLYPEVTVYEDGWLKSEPQYFGYFAVMVDETPPTIASIDFASSMKGRSSFSFRINDNLSDIHEIIPTIDGKWALMEYDAKANRLTYYFDESRITHGKHDFVLTLRDERGNEKVYTSSFYW
ncbi:MAG: peptidoglycan DD-metalloendopeptidase family protein, partial [Flavobacteriales bacterium]|nr:peptidoglycan DD-metalloendopeptidase family protein [Flavobacteriales bacterium]